VGDPGSPPSTQWGASPLPTRHIRPAPDRTRWVKGFRGGWGDLGKGGGRCPGLYGKVSEHQGGRGGEIPPPPPSHTGLVGEALGRISEGGAPLPKGCQAMPQGEPCEAWAGACHRGTRRSAWTRRAGLSSPAPPRSLVPEGLTPPCHSLHDPPGPPHPHMGVMKAKRRARPLLGMLRRVVVRAEATAR